MILLTSFTKSLYLPKEVPKFSVAVYAPRGFETLPKLDFFDIRDDGKWTRPRDFMPDGHDPSKPDDALLLRYRDGLAAIYQKRWDQIVPWALALDRDIALCCWCPYDQAAQRQLKAYGSFVCHTAVIGWLLPQWADSEIKYDDDRVKMVKW